MTNTSETTATTTTTGSGHAPGVWPCLSYSDARAAIRFLVDTLGFAESAVYGEGNRVDHAELTWPYGGGLMLGSVKRETELSQHPDDGSVYLVVPEDSIADDLYRKVVDAGATITVGLRDEDYGSHGFTCRDPHGVYFSIGTYPGHGFGE
ncbi:VOC family protein [Rhodococcus sp. (in: high G+C Gram-positive bacteria)]|uniref:VOC family protein n=1 Tax=Rhodococcus sp. TaxID=1831 RepID=UPI0019F74F0D|nr:VOC family protein [Rhodococcus sp. (in: high G+C Gram-positive bacteria)]MBF0659902.1 VOC family protein [Rhodococcus sp. (in: high G+C Gram-positive bacteria)]